MPRVDLTTSELHALLAPVLPHASTDTDQPEHGVVRLEARASVEHEVYARILRELDAVLEAEDR